MVPLKSSFAVFAVVQVIAVSEHQLRPLSLGLVLSLQRYQVTVAADVVLLARQSRLKPLFGLLLRASLLCLSLLNMVLILRPSLVQIQHRYLITLRCASETS
ncbi:hypothetical protein MLD38_003387 [Melastoma candidum]|uniref:Uncharacterized protein n=1 Tax=Melastoma candidum TaxID=119954 RepID=A0ACB9S297_9MYRT|nr:hypothetical protein MLD38_003387 [Melastoma candidum]